MSNHGWPIAAVIAAILIANLPYLLGVFDPNPMLTDSGLATAVQPGVLGYHATIDPNDGYTAQALTHRNAESWLDGRVPWWNPDEGLGAPAAGEMQSAALFLPFVLLTHFAEGDLMLLLLLSLIAGLATYALLRCLQLNRWACAAGGVAFGLNGTFAWFRHAPDFPVCFLPVMLLGVELIRASQLDGRPSRWWLLSLGLAFSLYAGFPETALLDGYVVALWCVLRLPGLRRDARRSYAALIACAAVVGLLLAAPILVAFADYLPHAYVGGHGGVFARRHLPLAVAPAFVFPYVFGPIFGFLDVNHGGRVIIDFWDNVGGYLTAATLLFALIGLRSKRPLAALRIGLAVIALAMVGRIYGVQPIARIFNELPGVRETAAYRYLDPAVALAAIVLAVLGLDALLDRNLSRRALAAALGGASVMAVIMAWRASDVVRSLTTAPHHVAWATASVAWAVFTFGIIGAGALLAHRTAARVALVALLPIEAIALFMVPTFSAPRSGQIDTAVVAWLHAHLGLDRFYTIGSVAPLAPDYGSYFGLAELDTNDVPLPKSFNHLVTKDLDPNTDAIGFTGAVSFNPGGPTPTQAFSTELTNYGLVGVKYLLVDSGAAPPQTDPPLSLVYHDTLADIYQLPTTRSFFSEPTGTCAVHPEGWEKVVVDCPATTTLTRLELEMPGWSATVNGHRAQVSTDADGLQTVALGSGRSSVHFAFVPPYMNVALIGLLLGALSLLLAAIWRWRDWPGSCVRRRLSATRGPPTPRPGGP